MDNRIITISREFGSGGRTIGKMTAEKLGIPYYDKELVKKVAVETGFDESCLNVFVHADADIRAERIVRLYGESEKSPLKRLEEKDKKRSVYYRYYTGREWGMAANYHIALNSGKLGLERCVELIAGLTDIQKALTS